MNSKHESSGARIPTENIPSIGESAADPATDLPREGVVDVYISEEEADVIAPVADPLIDFAQRVRACDTAQRLELLHTRMLRKVPVRQRADYIALLDRRDEELSFRGD
ncbi:TPA: hypothetical protein ACNV1G_004826 [Citrobacter amalonaticus]